MSALTADLLATLRATVRRLQGAEPPDAGLVRSTRIARGWSQREMAEALGVHRVTVANWERGTLRLSSRSRHQVLQLRD